MGTPRSDAALRWSPARMPSPPEYDVVVVGERREALWAQRAQQPQRIVADALPHRWVETAEEILRLLMP
jgi:hypothetical protein